MFFMIRSGSQGETPCDVVADEKDHPHAGQQRQHVIAITRPISV